MKIRERTNKSLFFNIHEKAIGKKLPAEGMKTRRYQVVLYLLKVKVTTSFEIAGLKLSNKVLIKWVFLL